MSTTAKTTIDRAGRLVVPKALRDAVGLEAGAELRLTVRDGTIELAPTPRRVRLQNKRGIRVAVPAESTETLDTATVEETRRSLHRPR